MRLDFVRRTLLYFYGAAKGSFSYGQAVGEGGPKTFIWDERGIPEGNGVSRRVSRMDGIKASLVGSFTPSVASSISKQRQSARLRWSEVFSPAGSRRRYWKNIWKETRQNESKQGYFWATGEPSIHRLSFLFRDRSKIRGKKSFFKFILSLRYIISWKV